MVLSGPLRLTASWGVQYDATYYDVDLQVTGNTAAAHSAWPVDPLRSKKELPKNSSVQSEFK